MRACVCARLHACNAVCCGELPCVRACVSACVRACVLSERAGSGVSVHPRQSARAAIPAAAGRGSAVSGGRARQGPGADSAACRRRGCGGGCGHLSSTFCPPRARLGHAIRMLDSGARLRYATRICDSETRLGNATRLRDSDTRLGCATRMYDSDVRLGCTTRMYDSDVRLGCTTRIRVSDTRPGYSTWAATGILATRSGEERGSGVRLFTDRLGRRAARLYGGRRHTSPAVPPDLRLYGGPLRSRAAISAPRNPGVGSGPRNGAE